MTIKDLAAKTGYGVGTVSRALNNLPNVSDRAREIILQAAEESGFELNITAKHLKQTHSNSILVIVKGIRNEFFADMLDALQTFLRPTSYELEVDYIDEDGNEVDRAVHLCRKKKPVGILFLGGNPGHFAENFRNITVPCVLISNDASSLPFRNLSSICADDFEIGRGAIHALADLGHRRIAVIGGRQDFSETSRLRYEGCKQAFAQRNIAFEEARDYRSVRFRPREGYEAVRSLLEGGADFTALFVVSDTVAVGAIRALREAGKRVPEDVSVLAVDGLPLGDFLVPQLATIRQNGREMALQGVRFLLEAIEEGKPALHRHFPFEIQLRESVRKI